MLKNYLSGLSIAEERKRRWAAKKAGVEYKNERESAMKELTGLVDSLVSNGQLEAYQYSYEKFKHFVSELESKAVDQLDMFSETTLTASKGLSVSKFLQTYFRSSCNVNYERKQRKLRILSVENNFCGKECPFFHCNAQKIYAQNFHALHVGCLRGAFKKTTFTSSVKIKK